MTKLIIPVGIPGCGKSTFADLFRARCTRVISSDTIRQDMVDEGRLAGVYDQSSNDEVFERYHDEIEFYLNHLRDDVYADATNLRNFARDNLCAIADRSGAEVHVFVFMNSNEAIVRNQKRERVVPLEAMFRMIEQYEQALKDIPQETYTSVTYIKSVA